MLGLPLDLWNDLAGDEINVMRDPSTPLWQKGLASVDLASMVINPAKGAAETLIKSAGKAAVKKVVSSELQADGVNASATQALQGVPIDTPASQYVTNRANELRTQLGDRSRWVSMAVAVGVDKDGNTVKLVSSNDLTDRGDMVRRKGVDTAPDEIRVGGNVKAKNHDAETNIAKYAQDHGIKLVDIAATRSQGICSDCESELTKQSSDIHMSSPLTGEPPRSRK